jgi:hypothetical protein
MIWSIDFLPCLLNFILTVSEVALLPAADARMEEACAAAEPVADARAD